MRSAVKISVALIFLMMVSVVVSLFVVPDATLRTLSGGQGELLVSVKRDVREDAANLLDDAYSAAKSVIERLSRGDIFDTLAAVEIEIPPDVLGQLRKDIRPPSAQSPSRPEPTPASPSQPQTENVSAQEKTAAPPNPATLANTTSKQAIELKSMLAPTATEKADPFSTGVLDEKADHMSPSSVMTKKIPSPPLATPSPLAMTSGSQKEEMSENIAAPIRAGTPLKQSDPVKMKVTKTASLSRAQPPMVPDKKVNKGEAKKPKQVRAVSIKPEVQSSASTTLEKPKPASLPRAEPSPTSVKQIAKGKAKKPKQVGVLSANPEIQSSAPAEKPKREASKSPSMSSNGGVDAHQRGMLHYRGNTVPKSLSEAAKWFRIAADNGHAGAQYNLGIMAFLGQGMTKDYTKAAKWFRMAGEQNHAAAQYNLGFLYYVGRGVAKDDASAYVWIDRAASLGDKKAEQALYTLRRTLPPEVIAK
ncbi:MAG: hypothetical protein CMF67_13955 [Magnetovibrio sp.]|nr:hypothetical protein [Magnetovibrio sp.]